jgi:hypothetical protein
LHYEKSLARQWEKLFPHNGKNHPDLFSTPKQAFYGMRMSLNNNGFATDQKPPGLASGLLKSNAKIGI